VAETPAMGSIANNQTFRSITMTLEQLINSLTLEQAQQWANETDKWVYVDDMILAPHNFRATDRTVGAVETQFENLLQPPQYANNYMFSDIEPYEIVRRISDKTIEIRPMDAEKDDTVALDFHVGGFSAHCSNQRQQKWIITSNATNPTIRIRLGKGGDWKDAHGRKFKLNQKPVKFYDYNF